MLSEESWTGVTQLIGMQSIHIFRYKINRQTFLVYIYNMKYGVVEYQNMCVDFSELLKGKQTDEVRLDI